MSVFCGSALDSQHGGSECIVIFAANSEDPVSIFDDPSKVVKLRLGVEIVYFQNDHKSNDLLFFDAWH